MTSFLAKPEDALSAADKRPVVPAPLPATGFGDVQSAGATAEAIETDWWSLRERTARRVEQETFERLHGHFGDAIYPMIRDRRPQGYSPTTGVADVVLGIAAELQHEDPVTFGDLIATREAVDDEVKRRLLSDWEEAQDVLAMGGRGAGLAEFLGRGGVAMSDPVSVAMVPFGGPMSQPVRYIATEAFLGGLGEAAILPRQEQVARDLDLPEPDWATQIGMGTIFGGGIAGGLTGAQRAWAYKTARGQAENATAAAVGVDPVEHAQALEAATATMRSDDQPEPQPVDRIRAPGRGWLDDLGVIDASDPEFHYGRTASARAQRPSGIVFHHTESSDVDAMVRYGQRVDAERGGAFGYHFYIATDGRIIQGAPMDRRTNHIKPPGSRERIDGTDLANENSIGISLVGASKGATPAQIDAAEKLAEAIMARYDIPKTRVLGHGELQGDRMQTEGAEALARLRGKPWARASGPVPDDLPQGQRRFIAFDTDRPMTTSRGFTSGNQVVTPTGRQIDVEYQIVDARLLKRATGDLQPRDRSRAASDEQIAQIAATLDPERLMPSPEADRGAPIVAPDDVIESGNGRVAAILRAADRHPDRFAAYRARLSREMEVPEDIDVPVLIARRKTELPPAERRSFVVEANSSVIARMSATETAAADAARLDAAVLDWHDPTRALDTEANRDLARAFVETLPQSERSSLLTSDGRLNADGLRRMRQALFARAYGAEDLTAIFAEETGNTGRAVFEALADAAPAWARMKAAIDDGAVRPEMDITEHLIGAARLVLKARARSREKGGSIAARLEDALTQPDLINGDVDPILAALTRVFIKEGRPRDPRAVARSLRDYTVQARLSGTTEPSFFADALSSTPREILYALERHTDLIGAGGGRSGPGVEPDGGGSRPRGPAGDQQPADRPGDRQGGAGSVDEPPQGDRTGPDQVAEPAAAVAGRTDTDLPDMAALDAELVELRADPDLAAIEYALEDGGAVITARDVLNEIDEDDTLLAAVEACLPKGGV